MRTYPMMNKRAGIIFSIHVQNKCMKLALFIIAALLATVWLVGFFIFNAGIFIHILMITAALFWMQGIIVSPKPQPLR